MVRLKKNSITKPVDINKNPIIDTTIFEDKRLYRPMAGKVYKMFPVETIRAALLLVDFVIHQIRQDFTKVLDIISIEKKEWI